MPTIISQSFYYDPVRQGYDTNSWRTLDGAPFLGAGGRINVNPGVIVSYADLVRGTFHFNLNVPDSAGSDASRVFGLYQPSKGAFIVFNIGSTFITQISDGTTTSSSAALNWNSAWNGTNLDFEIRWFAGIVKFYVAGTCVSTQTGDNVPAGPLSLYISDNSLNAMTIGGIDVRGTQCFINLKTSDTADFSGGFAVRDHISVSESVTMKIVSLVPSVFDSISVSENFVPLTRLLPSVSDSVTVSEQFTHS